MTKNGKKMFSCCFLAFFFLFCSSSFASSKKQENVYEQKITSFFKVLETLRLNDFSQTKTFVLPEIEKLEKPAIITKKANDSSYLNALVEKMMRQEMRGK